MPLLWIAKLPWLHGAIGTCAASARGAQATAKLDRRSVVLRADSHTAHIACRKARHRHGSVHEMMRAQDSASFSTMLPAVLLLDHQQNAVLLHNRRTPHTRCKNRVVRTIVLYHSGVPAYKLARGGKPRGPRLRALNLGPRLCTTECRSVVASFVRQTAPHVSKRLGHNLLRLDAPLSFQHAVIACISG